MKTPKRNIPHGPLSALLASSFIGQASAFQVDTELLLLVDVSGSVDNSEYSLMMDGYQQAFRNTSVVDAIQSGRYGSIAASVVFWSGANEQSVGLDWTLIDSAESANAFADALSSVVRPFSGMTAIGSGLEYGTSLFGDETGGDANAFESVAQIIDISGDGTDNNTPPDGADRAANVRRERDASLAQGVDMINGLPIGNAGGALDQYYIDNVIGGEAGGVEAFTQASNTFSDVEDALTLKLQREVAAGAEVSNAVPEPKIAYLLSGICTIFLLRRR